ncbi:hypothetical protein HZS_2065, partial [Henneguya salminicola]
RNEYSRTLFVGDLPREVTYNTLSSIFEKYGQIIDIDIKYLKFGVTTYAFIQFIDPIGAIAAHNAEQFCKIEDSHLKIGYGRATPADGIWIGGISVDEMSKISDQLQKYTGFKWLVTDTKLCHSIFKFDSLIECSLAYENVKNMAENQKFLFDFISYTASKKFIDRMIESGLHVNESILEELKDIQRPYWVHRRHSDNSMDDPNGAISHKRKDYREKYSRPSERNLHRDQSRSSSPTSYENRSRKRRVPSWMLRSPEEGSDDSKVSKSSPGSSDRTTKSKISREKHRIDSYKLLHKIWTGQLFLKSNRRVFDACLCDITKGKEKICSLKIGQRMKLDDEQLTLINQRLKYEEDTAFALALIDEATPEDKKSMKSNFIKYFGDKNAAGVVHIHDSKRNEVLYHHLL